MKQFIKNNIIILVAIAFCAAISLGVIFARMGVEGKNKTYDIILDYAELELLAEQSEHDVAWWMNEFKKMGITCVGLQEESFVSLMNDPAIELNVMPVSNILQKLDWRRDYPEALVDAVVERDYDPYDILVEATGDDIIEFVRNATITRFRDEDYFYHVTTEDGVRKIYILLDGMVKDYTEIMYTSIGFMAEKVELILSVGMDIIPRTICYMGHNDSKFAQAVLDGYEKYGIDPDYIIAGGEAVIGYDDDKDIARNYMTENNITLGLIETSAQREHIAQDGTLTIAEETDYNVVRVFSVWDYIQWRYAYYGYEGAEEIENTLFRAITERNIRLIYYKPIKQTDSAVFYVTDIEVYRDMFESLNERLAEHGITMGRASVMKNIEVHRLAILAFGLSAGLCGALLPSTVLPIRKKQTLLLAATAAVCVCAAWIVAPNTIRQVASFANAVVFACLAAAFMIFSAKSVALKLSSDAKIRTILPHACAILLISVALSLVGAMLTAAPLSSTEYMLELGIFRGVKMAQLIPLAFFCVLFVSYYGIFEKDRKCNTLQIRDIAFALKWTIPVWAIILAGAILLVGRYYIARTGHESSVSVSTLELMLRNTLESALIARPRTKEFLIAFPCIMLAVYSAVRRMPFFTAIFGLAGTIGLTSICNTFMHIRTPIYLGFARTGYSVLFGIILGAVMVIGFDVICRAWRHVWKKYIEAELS